MDHVRQRHVCRSTRGQRHTQLLHASPKTCSPPLPPQGRVTDHRVGLTLHGMEAVLVQGDIDPFIDALALDHQMRLLASLGA